MNKQTSGPFGIYKKCSTGHVLNALCAMGVPVNTVENIRFGGQEQLLLNNEVFANYKYFPGIEQPLFRFQNKVFDQQRFIKLDNGFLKPDFHLSLSPQGTAGLIISGPLATPELHEFLCGMFTNRMPDIRYELHQTAGAFFQRGRPTQMDERFYIEFWRPSGAEAFLDYINTNFVQPT